MNRLQFFQDQIDQNRFWWFKENNYLPPLYANLSDERFQLLVDWYNEPVNKSGECSIPPMSMLLGLIGGNNISHIVQLGHAWGYSTLLMGWLLQDMGKEHALYTVDISHEATQFTNKWIYKSGLENVVVAVEINSVNPQLPFFAKQYFGWDKNPELIFIDSSHNGPHTFKEIQLWMPALVEGGFMVFHDSSLQGANYDHLKQGGVISAIETMDFQNSILINRQVNNWSRPLVYKDGCGLGIVQKEWD